MKMKSGATKDSIIIELINNGWTRDQADRVFVQFEELHSQKSIEERYSYQEDSPSIVPPAKESQLKGGNLSQVNAYVVPQERPKKKIGFVKGLFIFIILIIIIFLGWYFFSVEGSFEKIYNSFVDLIGKYTSIDIPYLGQ